MLASQSSTLFFTNRSLTGHSLGFTQANPSMCLERLANRLVSLRDGLTVDTFTDAQFELPEPRSWFRAVNYAPQKAEPLGGVAAVPPNVVLCDLGVQCEETIHIPGLGEDVCSVAQLRGWRAL